MRALRFDGGEPRVIATADVPAPPEGEALIRTLCAGISRTDLEVCRGLGAFRGTLGGEFVGVVESINGRDEYGLKGTRIVGEKCTACGTCAMCLAGLRTHCRRRTILGLENRDGCLAEYFTLPVHALTRVPDELDNDQAVFADIVASAIQAARQITIEGKPYVTVLGDGALGMVTAQVMAKLNASVRLLGRYSKNLALCERWGVKHRHVDDIGRRADQDIVVDCTGSPAGLELAMQLARPRGKIVLKSLHSPIDSPMPAVDFSPLVLAEQEVIGSWSGPMGEAVSMIARGDVDVISLISRRVPLDDAVAALHAAAQPGAIKVLVTI